MKPEERKATMMDDEAVENTASLASEETSEETDEVSLIVKFKKPYYFEKKEYTEVDLSGLDDLQASDMIAVNKYMQRTSPGIDVMPEVSLEYACVLASKAAKLPIEFFTGLPPREAMKVKNRVMGFLFGSD